MRKYGSTGKRKKAPPQKIISSASSPGAEPAPLPAPLNAFPLESLVSGKPHAEYYTGRLNFTIVKLFNWGGEIQI